MRLRGDSLPSILLVLAAAICVAAGLVGGLAGAARTMSWLRPGLAATLAIALLFLAARRPRRFLPGAGLAIGVAIGAALVHDLLSLAGSGSDGSAMWLGVLPGLSLLMLAAMLAILHRGEEWTDPVVLALFSCALALSAVAFMVALTLYGRGDAIAAMGASVPGALAAGLVATGGFAMRRRLSQGGILSPDMPAWRTIRTAIPIAVFAPTDRLVLAANRDRLEAIAFIHLDLALTILNFLLIGLLFNWVVWKLAAEFQKLRRNEARLAIAVEAPGAGVFDWNLATGDLMWTPEAERAIGLEPGAMKHIGQWESRILPLDLEQLTAAAQSAEAQHLAHYPFRYRLETYDGRIRTFEGRARCFYGDAGELIRLVGINLDVTEHEERKAALEERDAQLRSIFEAAPDALILVGSDRIIHDFNPAAEKMFGRRHEEALGTDVALLLPEESAFRARYVGGLSEAEARGLLGKAVNLAARRANGDFFPAELTVSRTKTRRGLFYIAFVRDVSERMEAEQRLDDLRNEFAHTARLNALGELAAGMAHELNQPLAASANFLGAAQVIVEAETRDDDLLDLLDKARIQSLRAGQIMRRLRDYIAKGSADMSVEPVERIVDDAIAIALIGKEGHSIRVGHRIAAGAETMIADRVQIQQVLVNLLRNAAEAMREIPVEQREIRITAEPADPELVRFTVTDSGPGFSPEMLDQLFTPFLSTKGAAGMGIGLSICRRIVEAHGGEMLVANKPEGGACVRFTVQRA